MPKSTCYKLQIVMRTNHFCFLALINVFFITTTIHAQTANFDETWKVFLKNNKISNMSELARPDKAYQKENYAKYLLMNMNSCFCQSQINKAEGLMNELKEFDANVYTSIPGFSPKMDDLQAKMDAFYSMDAIWKQFLQTQKAMPEELEAVVAAKTSCEKATLAKYSYMTAYHHFCEGNIPRSKDIFENRTLRLTEKTSLRVKDVQGLAPEVAKMKALFLDMDQLDNAWQTYIKTGNSPGFDVELPLFPCNPIPNMKAFVLRGAVDICDAAPEMLQKVKDLQNETGAILNRELEGKIKELENAIQKNNNNLAALNVAWEAFIPDNKVKHMGRYVYEYCSPEPLIKAYIMDGFAYVCELGVDMLQKIETIRNAEYIYLDDITVTKINELKALTEQYEYEGKEIEMVWNDFIAQGGVLVNDYQSADSYCDNIHQVEDWTMRGLSSSCENGHLYLEQIDDFQNTFEFVFFEELECQVQKLRIKVWDCRHDALLKLARIEAPDAYEAKLEELMEEYGMQERPEVCSLN